MKRLVTLFAMLLCLGLVFTLAGCGSMSGTDTSESATNEDEIAEATDSPEDMIIGSWELDEEGTTATLNLLADDTFSEEVVLTDATDTENVVEGKYTIKDDEITLKTSSVDGKTKDEFTDDELMEDPSIGDLFETRTYTYKLSDDENSLVLTTTAGDEYTYTRIENK